MNIGKLNMADLLKVPDNICINQNKMAFKNFDSDLILLFMRSLINFPNLCYFTEF